MNSALSQNTTLLPSGTTIDRRELPSFRHVLFVLFCILLSPILAVVMGAVALAIKLDSPGPVFFIQERVGRYGKRFRIYKFRTLSNNHDQRADHAHMKAYISGKLASADIPTKPSFKPDNQNKYTRVGRFLRKWSLDEIPQIINVIRGDMTLVGPRPNVPMEVEEYQWWHIERLSVLPGLTGLAQVKGRSNLVFNQLVRYDIHYVRNQGLALDMKIIWWTVLTVLTRHGAG